MIHRHENAVLRTIDDLELRLKSEQSEMSDFHDAVERVAKALSRSASQETLTAQVLVRVAILAKTTTQRALPTAERVRKSIEQLKIHHSSEVVRITASMGVAQSSHTQTPHGLYERADAALYRSKNAGRNRVTIFDPLRDGTSGNRYQIYAV